MIKRGVMGANNLKITGIEFERGIFIRYNEIKISSLFLDYRA